MESNNVLLDPQSRSISIKERQRGKSSLVMSGEKVVFDEIIPLSNKPAKPTELKEGDVPDFIYAELHEFFEKRSEPKAFNYNVAHTVIEALAARKFCVKLDPTREPNYIEYINTYGLNAMNSGLGKSKIAKNGMRKAYEQDEERIKKDAIAEYNYLKIKEEIEKEISDLDSDSDSYESELTKFNIRLEENQLSRNRLIYSDITYAAMFKFMSETNKNILIYDEELSAFFGSLKDEYRSGIRGLLLTSWNGNDSKSKDTKGNDCEFIKKASVSFFGFIQLDLYLEILRDIKNGSSQDGFFQRFGRTVVSTRLPRKRPLSPIYKNELDFARETLEYVQRIIEKNSEEVVVSLSLEAQDVYYEFIDEINEEYNSNSIHPLIEPFVLKYPTLFASLAMIIELAIRSKRYPDSYEIDCISKEAALYAHRLTKLYRDHLNYSVLLMEKTSSNSLSVKIVEAVKNGSIQDQMTVRNILNRHWSKGKSHELNEGLRILENHNVLKVLTVKNPKGGRPSKKVFINPRFSQEFQ